ncbi:hypothetical protein ACFU7Y_05835 [Kitasatospora sp. NPDC057542]|uniref:hypothetical protein n=1 Tax=Streptomycetaceae TaxID=2062 RepID=UPI001CC959DA|nr:hypothetical protein [Streptomyces sp. LS1784]
MGWIEQTDDGRRIEHGLQLTDGELVIPGNAIDWWLVHGAVGAPLRSSCTCGWISTVPGPALPELPPAADPPTGPRPVTTWSADGPAHMLLPWWYLRDEFVPSPAVTAWKEYQIRNWQTHVAHVFHEGTCATDDPEIYVRRRIAALLDHAEEHPLPTLNKLRAAAEAVEAATGLAIAAARRHGHDWAEITRMLCLNEKAVEAKYDSV